MTYLGLRPGEKLYEELLVKTEELDKTPNSMIFIERDTPLCEHDINRGAVILNYLKKIFKFKLIYVVIGGWLPEEVNNNSKLKKELNKFDEKSVYEADELNNLSKPEC